MTDPEFIVCGHSHIFPMGAPRGYRGPRALVPCEAFGRRGFYFLDKDGWPVTNEYFAELPEVAAAREVIIAWTGNQNIMSFLFEPRIKFDFIHGAVRELIPEREVLIPLSLVRAHQDQFIGPLRGVLSTLKDVAAALTIVAIAPPRSDLAVFTDVLRVNPMWRELSKNGDVDLETARITPPSIMLKLWHVTDELMREAARQYEAKFVAVPAELKDEHGFLGEKYKLPVDFTHPNDDFGRSMLKAALVGAN